ncbi:VOC family protein [Actinoplanes palleronii]|uniref:Glyoxalase n=1 Tax=Actinoplanes palleronii TaxID=113570 RepID=A0ABQ4B1L4_9ACTN|nr:VOC family protein [Actinoplanes palleronii]GIE64452.1 glyoxalase [Actinoplanes palleronii]
MLRGLTTVTFFAEDLDAARTWYTTFLGVEPYFVREGGYLEWRVGDYQHELGIVNARFAPRPHGREPGGAIVYWAVDDLEAVFARLLELGATEYEKPVERGPGYVTASVTDPFGNVLGIMLNQHYRDVLAASGNKPAAD